MDKPRGTTQTDYVTWAAFFFASLLVTGGLVYLIQRSITNVIAVNVNQIKTQNMLHEGVILRTNKGDIEIDFYKNKASRTVNNFIKLTRKDFYDGTKFHRVIEDFMIQGGDPLTKDDAKRSAWGTGGPGYTFDDEINNIKLTRGKVAMANSGPNTNGSQFFILTAEATPWLDGKHTVFGEVVSGMAVVESIENVPTGARDIPEEPIVIEEVILK